jgi:hypothetical protein
MTTAPWLAGAVRSAYEVSSGNPTTTPAPTTARRAHCVPRGSRCRVSTRARTARIAATTARPAPMNSGERTGDREPGQRDGEGERGHPEQAPPQADRR